MQTPSFDVQACREHFPALSRRAGGKPVVYFDGPAGSQIPQSVADAVRDYLLQHNANCHGAFATSRETDALLTAAGQAVADLLGAEDSEAIAFGPNMTTLTFGLSRALARTWKPGDEILVTQLDHDANVTPWVLAARDAGATVRHVRFDPADCTLDLDDLRSKLSSHTRLVAVGCASNASGTINPIEEIVALAHARGAEVFVDAVHYAPHRLIDVVDWGCDYLACSAYKFFGPHVGILWGKRRRLEKLDAYKVRPAGNRLPDRWMTGTQNHEGIAGTLAAVEYLADLGRSVALDVTARRLALEAAFDAITAHEQSLTHQMLAGFAQLPSIKLHGISDPAKLDHRVPTFSISHQKLAPQELAERLAAEGIYVWHGNFYALSLSESLGLEPEGMVRIGLLHYNTADEVNRLLELLARWE